MTNKEAIRILKNAAFLATSTSYQAIEEAVEVATKALTSATDINVVTKDGEVIYRQQAIDIIEDFPHGGVWNVESTEEMVYRIKQLPSAQPEIVRCRDCKWFRRWINTDIEFCDLTEATVFCDDFCSRAERITDEAD